jgi:hypothetical protein
MNDGRCVVARIRPGSRRVRDNRCAQAVVRIHVGQAHALVHHSGQRHRGVTPAHIHPDFHERDDDAGVLADRPVAFGAHPRIGEYLRNCVLGRRRLFGAIRGTERFEVILRMVVGDELQRVGDALDEVLLADGGHRRARE